MRERDEMELHRKMKLIEGEYEALTKWGKIVIDIKAIPNYAGGKGCPDEILAVAVSFPILGDVARLSAPILVEAEKAGYLNAIEDLNKFCERSISGEQKSYLEIPMIVVGGQDHKTMRGQSGRLQAYFNLVQVPKRVIDNK